MFSSWSLSLLLALLPVSRAIDVYLFPQRFSFSSNLSPDDGSAALSRHLALDTFESLPDSSVLDHSQESFVGQGLHNSLLLTIDEVDAPAILRRIQPAYTISTPPSTPVSSLSSVISTYLQRASHVHSSIYSSTSGRSPWELDDVHTLSAFFESADRPAFAAVEISTLKDIRESYGHFSVEYSEAASEIRSFLDHITEDDSFRLAVVTFSLPGFNPNAKRQAAPEQTQNPLPAPSRAPPQEPIGSVSTCFATVDACNNGTNTCSGRGQCVKATKAGRSCFVCTCGVTKTGEGSKVKTETWVGQSCERKDVSGPFVLLTGTVIVIILLVVGSVSLLASVGDLPLPSTLMATAVTAKKD